MQNFLRVGLNRLTYFKETQWTSIQRLLVLFVCMTIVNFLGIAEAQERKGWEGGAALGLVAGSPNGTVLAENFTADYYVGDSLSIGAMVQLVPPGDYTQLAGAMVAKYHWPVPGLEFVKLVPLLGLGGMHAELRRDGIRQTDMSYYAAPGLSLDIDISKSFGVSATYIGNLYDVRIGPQEQRDRSSQSFFIGLRFRPDF